MEATTQSEVIIEHSPLAEYLAALDRAEPVADDQPNEWAHLIAPLPSSAQLHEQICDAASQSSGECVGHDRATWPTRCTDWMLRTFLVPLGALLWPQPAACRSLDEEPAFLRWIDSLLQSDWLHSAADVAVALHLRRRALLSSSSSSSSSPSWRASSSSVADQLFAHDLPLLMRALRLFEHRSAALARLLRQLSSASRITARAARFASRCACCGGP